jgi:hypothetical protein
LLYPRSAKGRSATAFGFPSQEIVVSPGILKA